MTKGAYDLRRIREEIEELKRDMDGLCLLKQTDKYLRYLIRCNKMKSMTEYD